VKKLKALLFLAPFVMAILSSGCGGPSGTPPGGQVTVETDYGYGFQNVGYTQVDPNVTVVISNADPTCANGQSLDYFNGKTNGNGQATFQVTCPAGQLLLPVRYPDTANYSGTNNCDLTNGTDPNGNPVYIYSTFASAAAPPFHLPCGQLNPLFVLSPGQTYATSPASALTMTGSAGTFTTTYGMPWVYFTNAAGFLFGQVTATTVSADGSSITFPITPLITPQNTVPPGNYLIAVSNVVPAGSVPQISGSLISAGSTTLSPVGGDVLSVTQQTILPPPPPPPGPCPIPILPAPNGVKPAYSLRPCTN
jgi:hypothetical protein